jgi:hypothetical protein
MIILESLSKLDNISLEELDLTVYFFYFFFILIYFSIEGLTLNSKQISDVDKLFANHSKLTCYAGPVRQTIEQFANNLLNLIHTYCQENQVKLTDVFGVNDENYVSTLTITYDQFRDGLRKAKIPFQIAQIENIIKYLVSINFEFLCEILFILI